MNIRPLKTGQKQSKVLTICADNISSALDEALVDDKYLFRQSCWFLNTEKKFRIFNFKGSTYISKTVSKAKAILEAANAQTAYKILNNTPVGNKIINIVVPQVIMDKKSDQVTHLISKYVGKSLNDNTYDNTKPEISQSESFKILIELIRNGIYHIGFIPRNISVASNCIYLFDWEDAKFNNNKKVATFDHTWQTLFLLNWSYIFNTDLLSNEFHNIPSITTTSEPPLLKFETKFKEIVEHAGSVSELRTLIDKVVLFSEAPIVSNEGTFYFHPNDLGHIVSDIYPGDIEVLFDILAYEFKSGSPRVFTYHILLMSHLINIYKSSNVNDLKIPILLSILMMLDNHISIKKYKNLLLIKSKNKIIKSLRRIYKCNSVINLFTTNKNDKLISSIEQRLTQIIHKIYKKPIESKSNHYSNFTNEVLSMSKIFL